VTTPTTDERSDRWTTIWTQGQTGTSTIPFASADEVSPFIGFGYGASSSMRLWVQVSDEAESEQTPVRVSEPVSESMAFDKGSHDFWNPKSFDELATEQRVDPVTEWERLTSNWPDGADFEEFFAAVQSARQEG
jgi:hypothetical protein